MSQQAQPLDAERLRGDFPILDREFDGTQLVYLDNAATSQTPEPVIEAIADYYREYNANVHRGIHRLSQEASVAYEEATIASRSSSAPTAARRSSSRRTPPSR